MHNIPKPADLKHIPRDVMRDMAGRYEIDRQAALTPEMKANLLYVILRMKDPPRQSIILQFVRRINRVYDNELKLGARGGRVPDNLPEGDALLLYLSVPRGWQALRRRLMDNYQAFNRLIRLDTIFPRFNEAIKLLQAYFDYFDKLTHQDPEKVAKAKWTDNRHGVWAKRQGGQDWVRVKREQPFFKRKKRLGISCLQRLKVGRCMAQKSRIDTIRCRNCAIDVRVVSNGNNRQIYDVCGWHAYDPSEPSRFYPAQGGLANPLVVNMTNDHVQAVDPAVPLPLNLANWNGVWDALLRFIVRRGMRDTPEGDQGYDANLGVLGVGYETQMLQLYRDMRIVRTLQALSAEYAALVAAGNQNTPNGQKLWNRMAHFYHKLYNRQVPGPFRVFPPPINPGWFAPNDEFEWDNDFLGGLPHEYDDLEYNYERYPHERKPVVKRKPTLDCPDQAILVWDRLTWLNMPDGTSRIELKQSRLPRAGLGLFAKNEYKRNDVITDYPGLLLTPDDCEQILAAQNPLAGAYVEIQYDDQGEIVWGLSFQDLRRNVRNLAQIGGAAMANDVKQKTELVNAKICPLNVDAGWVHHHRNSPDPAFLAERQGVGLFLVATEDIPAGREILTYYGPTYWRR